MSTGSTEADAPGRPALVDYAIYALIGRCVFSFGEAFALHGARGEVSRSLADANKDKHWSAATLNHNVDLFLRGKLINAAVTLLVIAILIKFLREGRNWARWLYLAFAILAAGDLFSVLGFFQYHDFLARMLTGLVGLCSIAALVLLFLPDSNEYFRPAGAGGGLLGSMFRPRGPAAAGSRPNPATARPNPAAAGNPPRPAAAGNRRGPARAVTTATGGQPVDGARSDETLPDGAQADGALPDQPGSAGKAAARTVIPAAGSADRRPAPRGKSRQSGQPKRGGSR
jgi:hypothetical protein